MNKPSVIALGFFDGVHRGHAALLQKAVQRAAELGVQSAVFTFDRPPKEVVTGRTVHLINSVEDRRDLMERLYGIDRVIFAPFDENMMRCSWQDFLTELLIRENGAVHLVAGHDYHFGYKNEGNPQLLQEACAKLGIGCDIIPKVELEGITVSSTYIRTLVQSGEMERAAEFLGHPHSLSQMVRHGQHFGRTIGIPTINLSIPEGVIVPRRGVYITRVCLPDGRSFPGVTNVGVRPTVSHNGIITVETFLLDFEGDLYDQHIRLEFFRHLRDEQRFDSAEGLKNQIHRDIALTRTFFGKTNL